MTDEKDYSIDEVINFYKRSITSGAIGKRTGENKLHILKTIKDNSLLSEGEAKDVRNIELQQLRKKVSDYCTTFGMKPTTINAYIGRMCHSIDEFLSSKGNISFTFTRRRKIYQTTKFKELDTCKNNKETYDFVVPIRGGKFAVRVVDVPCDLCDDEVNSAMTVIQALLNANVVKSKTTNQQENKIMLKVE